VVLENIFKCEIFHQTFPLTSLPSGYLPDKGDKKAVGFRTEDIDDEPVTDSIVRSFLVCHQWIYFFAHLDWIPLSEIRYAYIRSLDKNKTNR
jgi:hypothetical protein